MIKTHNLYIAPIVYMCGGMYLYAKFFIGERLEDHTQLHWGLFALMFRIEFLWKLFAFPFDLSWLMVFLCFGLALFFTLNLFFFVFIS